MFVFLLVLCMFVLIGVMTYLVVRGTSNQSSSSRRSRSSGQVIGLNIDTQKLKNKIFIKEVSNIIKNLNSLQPLVCEEYKSKLREELKKMHENIIKQDDIDCSLVQTSMNEMLSKMNLAYENVPNEKLRLIIYQIMNSTTKLVEELLVVICNEETQKVDKIAVFKLFENAVNTICNLGGDVI